MCSIVGEIIESIKVLEQVGNDMEAENEKIDSNSDNSYGSLVCKDKFRLETVFYLKRK